MTVVATVVSTLAGVGLTMLAPAPVRAAELPTLAVTSAEVADTGPRSVRPTAALAWRPCGFRDDGDTVVARYERKRLKAGLAYLAGGTSTLHCGSADDGYRHIVRRHLGEWEQMAAISRENWREVADRAIEATLGDPDTGSYRRSNDTFCFQRLIHLVDRRTGRAVGSRTIRVVVARESKKIITAFPGRC